MHDCSENERFIKVSLEIQRATGNNLNSRLQITASLCATQFDSGNQTVTYIIQTEIQCEPKQIILSEHIGA